MSIDSIFSQQSNDLATRNSNFLTSSNFSNSTYILDNTSNIFTITSGLLASFPDGLLSLYGNDKVIGSNQPNRINGNQGSDIILGGESDDNISGGKDDDFISGKINNDQLFGNRGNDFLLGGEGDDTLDGGEDSDILSGELGQDILTGAEGADIFVLPIDFATTNALTTDIITDFDKSSDLIQLTGTLTENDLTLEAFETGTLIKVRQTGAMLGRVIGLSPKEVSGSFLSQTQDISDPKDIGSLGQLGLFNVSETQFNSPDSLVQFELFGTNISNNQEDFSIFRNGEILPDSSIQLLNNNIVLSSVLEEGKNEIEIHTVDAEGYPIYVEKTLWAGSNKLEAIILDENGQPLNNGVVIAKLGDDQNVLAKANVVNGKVSFSNIPDRTIVLELNAGNNRTTFVPTTGSAGNVTLKLQKFDTVSNIDNNDFSLGTDGWNINQAPVEFIPHVEDVMNENQGNSETERIALSSSPDQDLVLNTSGEGLQSISRTFKVDPGTKEITIRYKFETSEVPGGYFGSQYNDYFNISMLSQQGGSSVSEGNSMNSLGLSSFDNNGVTAWNEVNLPVKPEGDTVQVNISVANVSDGMLDSKVIVDKIQKKKLSISELKLNDIDNNKLKYLSASPHSYFGGNTRINGKISLQGDKDDELKSLKLEVIQGGKKVASGDLADSVQKTLLNQAFGDDNIIQVQSSQLLFNLPSTELSKINTSKNGKVQLRVKAESKNGETSQKDFGAVDLLTIYNKKNRYGGRDESPHGGDDWVLPSVKPVIENFQGIQVGDISNMNGGRFEPHITHQNGIDIDGFYTGYDKFDINSAQQMINYLNDPKYGSRIKTVHVYPPKERSEITTKDPNTGKQIKTINTNSIYWKTINDAILIDGRRAIDVIDDKGGKSHFNHFHWSIKP